MIYTRKITNNKDLHSRTGSSGRTCIDDQKDGWRLYVDWAQTNSGTVRPSVLLFNVSMEIGFERLIEVAIYKTDEPGRYEDLEQLVFMFNDSVLSEEREAIRKNIFLLLFLFAWENQEKKDCADYLFQGIEAIRLAALREGKREAQVEMRKALGLTDL